MASRGNPQIHPETLRMGEYVRAITTAGSVHPVDIEFTSPVRCRKRHKSGRCKGRIRITPRTDTIDYRCTECEVTGTITDWRGCDCDMSRFAASSIDVDVLTIRVSEGEYKALLKVLMLSGEEEAIIVGAIWNGNEVVLNGSNEVFDELAGNIAFEANHSTPGTKKQMVLDGLCEKIERVVEG